MEVLKVGIYLEDRNFASALARGLAAECKKMNYCLLNSPEEGNDCSLIITGEECRDENAIRLVRYPSEERISDNPPYCVYQYKDSRNLINDLFFIYFKMTGRIVEHKGNVKTGVLVFASDMGGAGVTSVSLATAESLRRLYGSRCLYLNLCPINDCGKYLKIEPKENLLKLLYYLSEKRVFPLETLITRGDNVDYFSTGLINSHFDEMKPELLTGLLKKIEGLNTYDFLVVDVGNHFSRRNLQILNTADCICLLHREEMKSSENFPRLITREIEERIENGRIIHVVNFASSQWSENIWHEAVYISRDDEFLCKSSEGFEKLLKGNFGLEVAVLAKKIMEAVGNDRS